MSNSFFGGPLDLGPCNARYDTASGGENIDLGLFDQVTIRFGQEVTDLVSAQTGTRSADEVITAGYAEVEFGLAEATLERIAATVPGFELELDSASEVVGAGFGTAIGLRMSSIDKQMTLIRVFDGIESQDPLDECIIYKVSFVPTIELVYDAATQRFFNLMGRARRDPNQLSPSGRPLFLRVGAMGI